MKKIALALLLFVTFLPTIAMAGSLEFDGMDDNVRIPASDSFNFGSGDFTIETSVKFNNLNGYQFIFAQQDPGLHYNQLAYVEDVYKLNFDNVNTPFGGVDSARIRSNPNVFSPDTWYHVAVVRNGDNWYMYQNSNIIGSTTSAPGYASPDLSATFYLGACWSPNADWTAPMYYLNGELDEFRVWKTARTPEELAYWRNRPLSGNEEGLFAYYNFDDVSNNVAYDLTRYGNDGQIFGKPEPSPVPEPCTMILFGIGGASMAFLRRLKTYKRA